MVKIGILADLRRHDGDRVSIVVRRCKDVLTEREADVFNYQ
jgi:hypothetical protein